MGTVPKTGRYDSRVAEIGVVHLFSEVTIGATGSISSQTSANKSGFTVSRQAAGRYRVTFDSTWNELKYINAIVDSQGTVVDASWQIYTGYTTGNKYVDISHVVAGSETDPASGDILKIMAIVKGSGV